VITAGGNLRAKYVIHTVGPVYKDGKHNEAKLLSSAYESSLTLAVKNGIKSLAFPSISTGAYGYPINEAAGIALKTVMDFIKTHKELSLVRFVLFSDRDFEVYKKMLERLLTAS